MGQPDPLSHGAAEPILHEYIPGEADAKALLDFAASAGEGRLPTGFRQDGELLERPSDGRSSIPRERAISDRNTDTQRDRELRPDRETSHEGQLHYRSVFNPSVVPFKRVTALDGVNAQFVLTNRSPGLEKVRLSPFTGSPDRTLFWGSLVVSGGAKETLPIPSVAPDMEIHGYETEPKGLRVTFHRDGAQSFSVRTGRAGEVRLRFLVSAPNSYFSHAVPPEVTLADVPSERRPVVPAAVRKVAHRMHLRLGLNRTAPLVTLMNSLVAHFRAFEEGPLALTSGNTYEDLTVSQRGVCRHRSYAFVVTALALGLPARYVANEAHAFVEVWIPRVGWIRVDLGGATTELNVSGAENRAVHRPQEDPFPKPPSYQRGYSQLDGEVRGLTPRQRRGPRPRSGHGATRQMDPDGVHGGDDPQTPSRPIPDPSGNASRAAPPAPMTKPVTLTVTSAVTSGLRGQPLIIRGRITHGESGSPLARRPVELLLQAPGTKDLIILGEAVSGPNGGFDLNTTVPLAASVGTYRVVAYSPADKEHQAGWSR